MKTKSFLFVLFLACLATQPVWSQSKQIYTNPNFSQLTSSNETLAILPFEVAIKLRPKEMGKTTPQQLKDMEAKESTAIQSALHSYFLKHKSKGDLNINLQDVSRTNALLKQNGIDQENIASYSPDQLADMLGVDGVISGMVETDKPMSDGAAMALGLVVGFYGATNSGQATINIHDGETGELLWKYRKTLSRSMGSNTDMVINALMKKASKKLPYLS